MGLLRTFEWFESQQPSLVAQFRLTAGALDNGETLRGFYGRTVARVHVAHWDPTRG